MPKALGVDQEETVIDSKAIEGEAEDISELQASLDAEIDAIIAEFGGDPNDNAWKIHVKKIVPNQGVFEHCFSCTAAELPILDRIKDEYGPGAYQIYVFEGNRLRKKPVLRIAEQIKKTAAEAARDNTSDLSALVATMMDRQNQQMEQMQRLLTERPQAVNGSDPVAMMTAMMGAMVNMKELVTPSQPAINPMEMFVRGVEVMRDVGGGGAEKNFHDVILSVIKDVAPPLLEITKRTQQAGAARLPQPAPGQSPAQPETPQVTDQTGAIPQMSEEERQITEQFRGHVNTLVNMAKSRQNPELWAEVVYNQMRPEDLQGLVPRPDLIEVLAAYNPEVRQFAPWFVALRDSLREMMQEDGIWPVVPQAPADAGLTTSGDSVINEENNDLQSGVVTVNTTEPDATKLNSESTPDT